MAFPPFPIGNSQEVQLVCSRVNTLLDYVQYKAKDSPKVPTDNDNSASSAAKAGRIFLSSKFVENLRYLSLTMTDVVVERIIEDEII